MIDGNSRIGYELSGESEKFTLAFSPVREKDLPEKIYEASFDDIRNAVSKASSAFKIYSKMDGKKRAAFLNAIASEIEAVSEELTKRAVLESGLPEARINGERGRTVNQLKLFASIAEEGSWVEASIDKAQPDRSPLPKPDIRKKLYPLGPVAVFTASNFPLAFSTAGGDTASALAAGNPVIVKAHPLHPGTNEIVATAILKAAKDQGMPDGVFSTINASDINLAQQLALDERIKAIAFTGSYKGGKALFDLNQKRMTPIPVFSEMGSVNPVFLLDGIMSDKAEELGKTLSGSVCLGVGQFCTNPGILVGKAGADLEKFKKSISQSISAFEAAPMLSKGIKSAYESSLKQFEGMPDVEILGKSTPGSMSGPAVIAKVKASTFLDNPYLKEEIFGPFSLLVECVNDDEVLKVALALQGQLTTSLFGTEADFSTKEDFIDQLKEICGRVIFNGVPTGVEVCHSMQHGGPFPATTDSRFTSVGADAIKRFARPIAWQDAPQGILPGELKDDNVFNVWRKIDGVFSKDSI